MSIDPNRAGPSSSRLPDGLDLFAAAPDGIVVVDDRGIITLVNDLAIEMFEFERGDLVGQPIETLLPERFRDRHVGHRTAFAADPARRPMGLALQLYGRRRSGEEFPVDVSLNYQRDAAGCLRVIAFIRDTTAKRRLEEGLRASEENFRLLVEGVGDHAILMLDPLGRVVTWNQGAQRIKGWTPEQILGRHFSIFYLPEDIAAGRPEQDLERAAAEGRTQDEGWRVRAGGQRFWAETTLSVLRGDDGTLQGFAKVTRDRTENHQARARLDSVGELNRAALEQRPDDDLLALVVSRARAMVGATLVAAWSPSGASEELVVAYAEGDGAAALLGTRAPADSLITTAARVVHTKLVNNFATDPRVPPALLDAGLGSGLFVPLHAAGDTFAVLGVMMSREREPMAPHEVDLLQAFGMQASASFAHARARREVEQLHLVSERERIARDLHDTVIQRLFAVGLSLEATGRLPAPETQERLKRAVSDIDDTIRSIRSSIFSLEARADDAAGLRTKVLEVVAEAAPALTFEPSVSFDGPVDTLTTREITDNLVATLREALANTARHAQATRVTVTVSADDEIVLIVDDDGVGAETYEREGGHGVGNLAERARVHGGSASITPLSPHGTRVEWRVPTPP